MKERAMSSTPRTILLRADAVFLLVAASAGLVVDIAGSFFGMGVETAILNNSPGAGIGFIEAHGLALIIGVLLWRAAPLRSWHLTAAAVHLLLGSANLAFWQFFIEIDAVAMGYVTTLLHGTFAPLQLAAALVSAEARLPLIPARSEMPFR
jgi:hypothetical protein